MALRMMLPSKAKVGDTIHFVFPNPRPAGVKISAFEVTINGKKIDNPETVTTRVVGGGSTNFVFKVSASGTYQLEITPIIEGKRGEPRLNTLEVENSMI